MEELEMPLATPGYTVSNLGLVYSHSGWRGKEKRTLAQAPDRYGYLRVHIKSNGIRSSRQVHRLVCEAFHGPPANRLHQVRHLDGNKLNNRSDNLIWGTAKENADDRARHGTTALGARNGMAVLTPDEVVAIRVLYAKGMRPSILAAWLGTTKETIIKCAKGHTYA